MLVEPQYIEQTPPQSMHVWINLNFIAYIVKLNLWWSFLYIFAKTQHAYTWYTCMKGKCLSTKLKAQNQIPLNPLNFSPIGIDCRNGKKNLESQYNMNSSIKCAFLKMWVESNAHIHWRIIRGNQTILRIQRLQKDEIILNISTKEKTNREIQMF